MPTNFPSNEALDVPLCLDPSLGSHSRQVHAALRDALLDGRIAPGARLPSSRVLARQIGVQRNAIVIAYEHLLADGLLESRIGAGTYAAAILPAPSQKADNQRLACESTARPGMLALGKTFIDPILMRRLASALKRRIIGSESHELSYGDPRGSKLLRQELAAHLASTRGIRCNPDNIVVTNGAQQALRFVAEALLKRGDPIWFEDPGYSVSRTTLTRAGLRPVAVPMDSQGIDVQAGRLADHGARAVYVTPSNQFPTGVTMTMERRVALIDWARASNAWVIEDDYDNEFRYEGPPLTALAGINSDRVLYIGTFSKTLFAGLRIAYLVAPPAVVESIVCIRPSHDRSPAILPQLAVADLLQDGSLASHTRRMRARYKAGRDLLALELNRIPASQLRVVVPPQGLHLVAYLPFGLPGGAAAAIRTASGLKDIWLINESEAEHQGPDGFILGFAGHEPTELKAAAQKLTAAVTDYFCRG